MGAINVINCIHKVRMLLAAVALKRFRRPNWLGRLSSSLAAAAGGNSARCVALHDPLGVGDCIKWQQCFTAECLSLSASRPALEAQLLSDLFTSNFAKTTTQDFAWSLRKNYDTPKSLRPVTEKQMWILSQRKKQKQAMGYCPVQEGRPRSHVHSTPVGLVIEAA